MIDKLKNYFWPVKDDYGKKLSHEETLEYCKSRFAIVALIHFIRQTLYLSEGKDRIK